jgi:hypothetical protein
VTFATFGSFPHADPDRALAWQEGSRALYSYRYRHGVEDPDRPLGGSQPRQPAARADRARAQRRIAEAQRRLGHDAGRGVDRSAATRAPTIGR